MRHDELQQLGNWRECYSVVVALYGTLRHPPTLTAKPWTLTPRLNLEALDCCRCVARCRLLMLPWSSPTHPTSLTPAVPYRLCFRPAQLAADPGTALADTAIPAASVLPSGSVVEATATSVTSAEVQEVVPTIKLEGELAAQFKKVRTVPSGAKRRRVSCKSVRLGVVWQGGLCSTGAYRGVVVTQEERLLHLVKECFQGGEGAGLSLSFLTSLPLHVSFTEC